jgi:hypothetical protein
MSNYQQKPNQSDLTILQKAIDQAIKSVIEVARQHNYNDNFVMGALLSAAGCYAGLLENPKPFFVAINGFLLATRQAFPAYIKEIPDDPEPRPQPYTTAILELQNFKNEGCKVN